MATTAAGTPYVESSDLVANYPGVSLALANHIDDNTGKILQVVHGETTTAVSSSSTSFVDTTLTASITPSSASSKILVMFSQNGCVRANGSSLTGIRLQLVRDATALGDFSYYAGYTQTDLRQFIGSISGSKLDAPATTSALTYKTQFRNEAAAASVTVQNNSSPTSTIVLMEVGA